MSDSNESEMRLGIAWLIWNVVCLILTDPNKIDVSYSVAVLEEFDMFWRN